jgi:hypothetical protein
MRLIVIALLLLSSHIGLAQKDTVLLDNKFALKTSPLAFIDPYGSYSYRLGMECKLVKNFAFSIEAGKYYNVGGRFQVKINPQGFIIRPEIKWYMNTDKLSAGDYMSLDFFYKKIDFDYKDSLQFYPSPAYQKQYSIWKEVYSANVRYGVLVVHRNKIITEGYVGVGIRYITGHNSLTPDENDHILTGENHGDVIGAGQRAISGLYPNVTAGFKIGYSFKSKLYHMNRWY